MGKSAGVEGEIQILLSQEEGVIRLSADDDGVR
jgi:hypothetical protein